LIDYLERFIGDLVQRSERIAQLLESVAHRIGPVLAQVADREAGDAAPGDADDRAAEAARRLSDWQARWQGLAGWFLPVGTDGLQPPQAELLRARARSAIPQLLAAVSAVNERRSGRSDRSADFRTLGLWFAECADDAAAHRLARAALALQPARHLALAPGTDAAPHRAGQAMLPWAEAPPIEVHPRLRRQGLASPRSPQPRARLRDADRARLAGLMQEEARQIDAARRRLATGQPVRLSALGGLDDAAFGLFLGLLGDALAEQAGPDAVVERDSGDGQLRIRLEPLGADSQAVIHTPRGRFQGRDHWLTITAAA
jgi:uncharacterized protein (TIGR02677 family)